MKKISTSLWMVMLAVLLVGCSTNQAATIEENKTENGVQDSKQNTPEETKVYYILSIDEAANALSLDEIEWVTWEDTDRLEELHFDVNNDLPGGFYLYNEAVEPISVPISDKAQFVYLDYTQNFADVKTDYAGFKAHYQNIQKEYSEMASLTPYDITIKDGEITTAAERYVP